jgi:hypothetical protein
MLRCTGFFTLVAPIALDRVVVVKGTVYARQRVFERGRPLTVRILFHLGKNYYVRNIIFIK